MCEDGSVKPDSALLKWSQLLVEAGAKIGRFCDSGRSYKAQLEAAGYVNVVEKVYRWPQNKWPKDEKLKELGEGFVWEYSGYVLTQIRHVES